MVKLFIQTLHDDCSYIQVVHLLFCVHFMIFFSLFGVLNLDIFFCKGVKTDEVTDYTNQTPPTHFGWKKMSKFNTRKNVKIFIKCAQNKRCTSSIYEQSLCKV